MISGASPISCTPGFVARAIVSSLLANEPRDGGPMFGDERGEPCPEPVTRLVGDFGDTPDLDVGGDGTVSHRDRQAAARADRGRAHREQQHATQTDIEHPYRR